MAHPAQALSSLPLADDAIDLCPAHVTRVHPTGVDLRLRDGRRVSATLALALPYRACEGDQVLVVGRDGEHWVIGVISGKGKTELRFQGDVELHAVGGSLEIGADRGVKVSAPSVGIHAKEVIVAAESLIEKVQTLYQRVRDLASVHAKRTHTVVDETAFSKAKSQTILTEEAICINGKQIHLG